MIYSWLSILQEQNTLLLSIVLICIIIAIILTIIEIILKRKVNIIRNIKEPFYLRQLKKIKKSDKTLKERLDLINIVSKSFFNEAFNLNPKKDYDELIENFKAIGKNEYALFCGLMLRTYYAGGELTKSRIDYLTNMLASLIRRHYSKPINPKTEAHGNKTTIINRLRTIFKERRKKVERERLRMLREKFRKIKEKRILIEKARMHAREARERGYKEEQIRKEFLRKGWSEEDIKNIMR